MEDGDCCSPMRAANSAATRRTSPGHFGQQPLQRRSRDVYQLVLRSGRSPGADRPGPALERRTRCRGAGFSPGACSTRPARKHPGRVIGSGVPPVLHTRTGHWLGLDVHDAGEYKLAGDWRVLEPGMVLTINPAATSAPRTRYRKHSGTSAFASGTMLWSLPRAASSSPPRRPSRSVKSKSHAAPRRCGIMIC